MMERELLKKKVWEAIDRHADEVIARVGEIDRTPELGFQEFETSRRVSAFLRASGYEVEEGLALTGLRTSLRPGASGPNVALLGELDAVVCRERPGAAPNGAAHACGHNLQLGIVMLVAQAMREAGAADVLPGNVTFMAVPAEEYIDLDMRQELRREGKIRFLSGKQEFIRLGLFDGVDAAMLLHAEADEPEAGFFYYDTGNGFRVKEVVCRGRAAHAANAPERGINALHALIQGINGINALRDTLRDGDHARIHYIITHGGDNVNSVPSETRLQAYVRAASAGAMAELSEKFDRVFRSVDAAFGTTTTIRTLPGYLPLINDPTLNGVFVRNAAALVGNDKVVGRGHFMASTDLGDLSHLLPVIQPMFGGVRGGLHAAGFGVADYDAALVLPAKAAAGTLIDLLCDGTAAALRASFVPELTPEAYLELLSVGEK